MADAQRDDIEAIIGRSLLTAETIASALRRRVVRELSELRGQLRSDVLVTVARDLLDEVEPILAQAMTDADLAAWVAGADSVVRILPAASQDALVGPAAFFVPSEPPGGSVASLLAGGDEPVVRFPLIERAAESLIERDIVTRPEFDRLAQEAKARAFTVARQESLDALDTIRNALAETTAEGASLQQFRRRLTEDLDGSFIGPAHRENVYRTNIQAAFHQAHDELASNPVVAEVFPYQEYLPIKDSRTRPDHLALASLGLNGTAVYRRDDPMWELFSPPWDYQCRCGVNLLTIEAAARKGVTEARQWLRTGQPPSVRHWRIEAIPFRPDPDWSRARRFAVT